MDPTNIPLQPLTVTDLRNGFNNVNRLMRDILTANAQQGTWLHSLALTSRFNDTQTVADPEPLIKLLNEEINSPTSSPLQVLYLQRLDCLEAWEAVYDVMREQQHAKVNANKVLMFADKILQICKADACEDFFRKRETGLPCYTGTIIKLQMLSRFDNIYSNDGYPQHKFCNQLKDYRQLPGSIAGKEVTAAEEVTASAKSGQKLFRVSNH